MCPRMPPWSAEADTACSTDPFIFGGKETADTQLQRAGGGRALSAAFHSQANRAYIAWCACLLPAAGCLWAAPSYCCDRPAPGPSKQRMASLKPGTKVEILQNGEGLEYSRSCGVVAVRSRLGAQQELPCSSLLFHAHCAAFASAQTPPANQPTPSRGAKGSSRCACA